jgi:hypothetical protein
MIGQCGCYNFLDPVSNLTEVSKRDYKSDLDIIERKAAIYKFESAYVHHNYALQALFSPKSELRLFEIVLISFTHKG